MYCVKCGTQYDGKFCPACGTPAHSEEFSFITTIKGKQVDLSKIIQMYGTGIRKVGAFAYLSTTYGISQKEAHEILDSAYAAWGNKKVSFANSFASEMEIHADEQKEKKEEFQKLKDSGVAYCPKCHSTSISANKRGFSFGKAALGGTIGSAVGLDVGLLAGGIGANKIKCTCLVCGYQWIPCKK